MPKHTQETVKKRAANKPAPDAERLSATGRVPRSDPALERLDAPVMKRAVVRVQAATLKASCTPVEGAERYDWQVRRGEGHSVAIERSSEEPRTEFTGYPKGTPGVPEVRSRALSGEAISEWSDWLRSEHDMGIVER